MLCSAQLHPVACRSAAFNALVITQQTQGESKASASHRHLKPGDHSHLQQSPSFPWPRKTFSGPSTPNRPYPPQHPTPPPVFPNASPAPRAIRPASPPLPQHLSQPSHPSTFQRPTSPGASPPRPSSPLPAVTSQPHPQPVHGRPLARPPPSQSTNCRPPVQPPPLQPTNAGRQPKGSNIHEGGGSPGIMRLPQGLRPVPADYSPGPQQLRGSPSNNAGRGSPGIMRLPQELRLLPAGLSPGLLATGDLALRAKRLETLLVQVCQDFSDTPEMTIVKPWPPYQQSDVGPALA